MKSRKVLVILGAFLIAVVAACGSSLWAQSSSTGAITGTVTDPSGAIVPNATVTLTNNGTGQTQSSTTNAGGIYRFALLAPGTYSLRFTAEGFKTSDVPSVIVNVTETPVLNQALEIGASSQSVTITGEAPTIETQTSAVGTLVDNRAITEVPLTTRNYTQTLSLSAGGVVNVYNAGSLGMGTQDVNTNGMSSASNNYQMDGSDVNNWASGTGANAITEYGGIAIPNPDAIDEFKIQTSQYDAGSGRNAGANVNVVTKGGTNSYHGTLWEFNRNTIFDANDFFREQTGAPRPDMKQNQFGGAFGGPVKKDKLFFFVSYQGTRQVNGLDTSALSNDYLPPLTNTRTAAAIGSEFCPANQASPKSFYTFAGGSTGAGTQVACDGSNINPVALAILNLQTPGGGYFFPSVTAASLAASTKPGLGFVSYSIPSSYSQDQVIGNADYVISSKNTLSERFFYDRIPEVQSFGPSTAPTVPGSPVDSIFHDYNGTMKLTTIISTNMVNEARLAEVRDTVTGVGEGVPSAASVGMIPADKLFPEIPAIVLTGSLGGYDIFGGTGNDWYEVTDTRELGDQLSWTHGKQTWRFGGEVERSYWHLDAPGRSRGTLTFENFTDFLIGENATQNGSPSGLSNIYGLSGPGISGAQESVGKYGDLIGMYWNYAGSWFVQNDIKVNSKLTLNLGVRWEFIPGSGDVEGKAGNFIPQLAAQVPVPPLTGTLAGVSVASNYDPNITNPYTGQPIGPIPAGVLQRNTSALYLNGTPKDNFAPRLGFAWQPFGSSSHLVVRGGYGWFYQTYGGNTLNTAGLTTPPYAQRISNSAQNAAAATLAQPYPTVTLGFIPRVPTCYLVTSTAPCLSDSIGGPYLFTPMVQEWSLNTQYEFPHGFVMEVGYVGNNGSHLIISHGLNQPVLATSGGPVNCGYDGNAGDCLTTNTSSNAPARVPIMGETATALSDSSLTGVSWYQGLQATVRKHVTSGLTFQAAYTYSKTEANTTWENDLTNVGEQWARASFDRTQRLIVNYIYAFPSPGQGIEKVALGGWTVSGITTVQTGLPIEVNDSAADAAYGHAASATVTLCPGDSASQLATKGGNDQSRLFSWFNSSVICPAPVVGVIGGVGGATGFGNAAQNAVNGPGQFNFDISLAKMTHVGGIREDGALQFRVEFYNAFNHPQFNNPSATYNSSLPASGNPSFGLISSSAVAPRLIQLGLKYIF